jgi:hypothetical protein
MSYMELFGMDEVKNYVYTNVKKYSDNVIISTNFGMKKGDEVIKFYNIQARIVLDRPAEFATMADAKVLLVEESVKNVTYASSKQAERDISLCDYDDTQAFFDVCVECIQSCNIVNYTGIDFRGNLQHFVALALQEILKVNLVLSSEILKPSYNISPLLEKIKGMKPKQKEFLISPIPSHGIKKHLIKRYFTRGEILEIVALSVLGLKEHAPTLFDFLKSKGLMTERDFPLVVKNE